MPQFTIEKIWFVYRTVDEMGRHGELVGFATTWHHANIIAKGKGWWGGDGAIVEKNALVFAGTDDWYILDSNFDVPLHINKAASDEALRKAALAKLTAEEIKLLGIK